jgi:hypothetical protein
MGRSRDRKHFPDDLQEVAEMLGDHRPALTALELDRVKLRAMSGARRSSSRSKRSFLRSRPAMSLLTVAFLAIGTGGALAGGAGNYGGSDHGGSAGDHQYRPSCPSGWQMNGDYKCIPNCKSGWEMNGNYKCIPNCPSGWEMNGDYKCIPNPPPPPPKCKSGWELSGNKCIVTPPPPPKCKSGWELSGNKCIVTPPPPHRGHH